jgi:uncharacterized membrane protein YbhN (UPF0104 family)
VSLARLLRLTVAVALTAYVLWASDPASVLTAARGADLRWIAAAVALVFVDRTLMALRWIDLLAALAPGSRPRLAVVLRVFFVSSFVSNFVPSVAPILSRLRAVALRRAPASRRRRSCWIARWVLYGRAGPRAALCSRTI